MEKKRKMADEEVTESRNDDALQGTDALDDDQVDEPISKKQMNGNDVLTSETLAAHAQGIIDDMEVKRKNDETLIAEFRKTMEIQSENYCQILEGALSKLYTNNNEVCQEKLQQLYGVLGRINQLEQEMGAFKQSLKLLYTEVETT